MDDVTPKLYEVIKNSYDNAVSSNAKIKAVLNKINKGSATYEDALQYAKELGACLEKAFKANVSDVVLPDGKMYYNIAQRLVEPMVKSNYDKISKQCAAVQTALNQNANIGLKGIVPKYNEDKTKGIIDYVSNADKYSQVEESFLDSLSTNAKSVVDDSVRENADFHYQSGLSPKIIRTTSGKTCKWCQEVAGVYEYEDVKKTGNDVFRRHANCDCSVVYAPANGSRKMQNVYSKKWLSEDEKEKIAFRKTIGLQDERQLAAQRIQKVKELNSKLTAHQEDAINQYISSSSYNINEKLRQNLPLTDEENVFIINMDRALDKMPKYEGDLTRSLFFDYENDLNNFLEKHQVGNVVEYPAYTSATFGKVYNPNGQVQLYIPDSKNGRNISSFNSEEKEILYQRNSKFKVLDWFNYKGKIFIEIEEV